PASQRLLFDLALVQRQARDAAYPDGDDGLTMALRDVITDALRALGTGPSGEAARLLFGSVPDSRGRTLPERRRLAGLAFEVVASTFRRSYEPQLVREVAAEILRGEHNPGLQVINNPDPPAGPASDAPTPLNVVIDTPDTVDALHPTPPQAPSVPTREHSTPR